MDVNLIHREIWTIYEVDEVLMSFLESLEDNYSGMVDQILPLLERITSQQQGPKSLNKKICHRIDDDHDIWQIRKGRIRLLWFYDKGRVIVCAHTFLKKSQKTPRRERDKARRVKKAYFQAKQSGQLNIIDDIEK